MKNAASSESHNELKIYDGIYEVFYYAILRMDSFAECGKSMRESCGCDLHSLTRDKNHFSKEANYALVKYFKAIDNINENDLCSLGRSLGRILRPMRAFICEPKVMRDVQISFHMDLLICREKDFERIVPVLKPFFAPLEGKEITLSDVLHINHGLRRFYDTLFHYLLNNNKGLLEFQFINDVWLDISESEDPSKAHHEYKYGSEHYCKVLSFCTVNNMVRGEILRWHNWDNYLAVQLSVGARFKRNPFTDDDVCEYDGKLLNPPSTDRFYQQWASTRYATNPAGTFILSLAYNHGGEVNANTNLIYMKKWVSERYLPIMVLVHFQQNILQAISADTAERREKGIFKNKLIQFRKELWLYTVTHDIQDERIWVETKAANRLDDLFTALNGQVSDEAQETLNKGVKFLTIIGVAVGLLSPEVGLLQIFTSSPKNYSFLHSVVSLSAIFLIIISYVIAKVSGFFNRGRR